VGAYSRAEPIRASPIIVINSAAPNGRLLAMVVVFTVFLSLIARGLAAKPLAIWLVEEGVSHWC
jgi:hypothetical protein